MTILLETLGDPIWQAITIALVLAALLLLMVVRTRDTHLSEARKRLESRLVLVVCLVVFAFMSGGEILLHPQQASSPRAASRATDRFGRSGDIDYRFTMSDQDNVWTISGVCTIMSEGCFAIDWG